MKNSTVKIKGIRINLLQTVGYCASTGKVSGLMILTQGGMDEDGETPYIFIKMDKKEVSKCILELDRIFNPWIIL